MRPIVSAHGVATVPPVARSARSMYAEWAAPSTAAA
jgi:hypothetical protein